MRKYSNRSLRNLKGVHPDLRRVIDRALQESPLDFIVIEGLRTMQRQRELVASGASKTMNSRHLTGHAVDLLPIGANGPAFDWPLYDRLGPAVKAAAEAEGVAITWGGDWQSFRDGPHFQLSWDEYPTEQWVTGDEAPKVHRPAIPEEAEAVIADADKSQGGSSTIWALLASGGGTVAAVWDEVKAADPMTLLGVAIVAAALIYVYRERLRKAKLGRAAKEALGL